MVAPWLCEDLTYLDPGYVLYEGDSDKYVLKSVDLIAIILDKIHSWNNSNCV